MKYFVMIVVAAGLVATIASDAHGAPGPNTIYDSDTNHLWNRLNETLFERTAQDGKKYGLDELEILYWFHTTNLLVGASHQQAISILDEFIGAHGEKLIHDPVKRILLQNDLWQLFNWTALDRWDHLSERRALQKRLAIVIRRLALTTNEIAALPDNYSLEAKKLPDLPPGLFQTNGDWVNLAPDPNGFEEIAPAHSDGHSAFLVMLHLPEGRQATISYLNRLRTFEHFWMYHTNDNPFATTNSPREILTLNTNLPEFPTNTEWALVRRMLAIDVNGNIQPTPIIESIQLRRYLAIAPPAFLTFTNSDGREDEKLIPPQEFYEFQMDRRQNGEVREIAKGEKGFLFVHFMSQGFDPFENESRAQDSSMIKRTVLESCTSCHAAPGIYSVNVYAGIFHPRDIYPPGLYDVDINHEINASISKNLGRYNWGLLEGFWNQPD